MGVVDVLHVYQRKHHAARYRFSIFAVWYPRSGDGKCRVIPTAGRTLEPDMVTVECG